MTKAYERGKALNEASIFGIDPAESRSWVASTLKSVRPPVPANGEEASCD